MNLSWKTLSLFFAVQVGVFLFLNQKEKQTGLYTSNQKLFAFDSKKINRIEIEDQEKNKVVLIKNSQGWVLSSLYDFPAYSQKANSLLEELETHKKTWPAGTTESASRQLATSESKFEKKFKLFANDKLVQTLYIGTSPSFKKSHIRVAGENNSYAISFNAFDFPTESNEWIDRSHYSLKKKQIKELRVKGLVIDNSNKDNQVTVASLAPSEFAKTEEINQILNLVLSPSYHKVLSRYSPKELGEEVLNYEIITDQGVKKIYSFYKNKKDKDKAKEDGHELAKNYVMKVSDSPYYLEVDESSLHDLLSLKRENLVQQIKKGPEKEIITMKKGDLIKKQTRE